jgi:hypothetical protein
MVSGNLRNKLSRGDDEAFRGAASSTLFVLSLPGDLPE